MANLTFNTNEVRRVPINRNNMFYSEADFYFETEIGKDYLEQDVNQTVVLYEVDLEKTNRNEMYGETKSGEVVFKTPVELHVIYIVEKSELSAYDKSKNLATFIKSGKMRFGVFQATLDELGVNIKVGDYVGIAVTPTHMEYFCVNDCGRNNFDNAHTTFGYKPSYRTVTCSYVNPNEFNGK